MLQPVLVRPAGDGYELIAGERRWRAARAGRAADDPRARPRDRRRAALEQAVIENLHRDDLNPLEEAAAYQQLIEDFGLTHDEVAASVGKSRATISNTLRLLQLPPTIQRAGAASGSSRWVTPARCSAPRTARSRSSSPSSVDRRTTCRCARSRRRCVRRNDGDGHRRRPTNGSDEQDAAAGAARARGAARRPPRDPGEDPTGRRRQGRDGRVLRRSRTSSGSTAS